MLKPRKAMFFPHKMVMSIENLITILMQSIVDGWWQEFHQLVDICWLLWYHCQSGLEKIQVWLARASKFCSWESGNRGLLASLASEIWRFSISSYFKAYSGTMIKFFFLDFLSVSYRIPWANKNAVYHFQISSLVPEIFKCEKWFKYANEKTDDVIHSTQ